MFTRIVPVTNVGHFVEKRSDNLQIHRADHFIQNHILFCAVVFVNQNQLLKIPIVIKDEIFKEAQSKGMLYLVSMEDEFEIFAIIV